VRVNRSPKYIIAASIVAFPLLKPAGPGHVTPCDVLMAAAILVVVFWAGTERVPFHVPYAIPVGILVVTGALAAQFSIVPGTGLLAVGKEVFLLLWAAAIATFCSTPENLSVVLAAWAWGAVAWGSLVIGVSVTHQWWIFGMNGTDGARMQMWFDNPNMAGNYFLISLFVVLLGPYPRRPMVRFLACAIIVAAIALTGSNAALLSLVLGVPATFLVKMWRRVDLVNAIAASALVSVLLLGFLMYAVKSDLPQRLSQSSNEIVSRSLARGPKSAVGRSTLFTEEFQLYLTGSLLGRGPASTQTTLEEGFGSIVKEAHDDFLATLIERGPLGVVGLIILLAGIALRAFSVSLRPLAAPFARLIHTPGALVGCLVAIVVTSTTHEVLHYRHIWGLLGILAALYLFARARSRIPPAPEPA
jgi:hypothetical protein